MSTDDVDKVDKSRRKHEQLFKKLEERGYDVDNMPPLTEQQRDEFETVIHNAHRTGNFDWSIKDNKSTEPPSLFPKIVLATSAIIPLYLVGYFFLGVDGILRFLVPAIVLVCLVHMYFGFKWASYVVAFSSLIPVYAQILLMGSLQAAEKYFLFSVLIGVTINSYLLLKSKTVSQFLIWQQSYLSNSELHKLKLLRLALAVFFIGVITADVARLVSE